MTGSVLVVDDVPQNVRLLEAKLQNEYYTVHSVYSGVECLEKVKDISPDIILLDVMMPELDGFETCRRLKADVETAHIPVVMVTALGEVSDRIEGLQSGANDFISKPIDEMHLFARVKSLVRLKTMTDELRVRNQTSAQFGPTAEQFLTSLQEDITGKIMVIDDDVVQSKKMLTILSEQGHDVDVIHYKDMLDVLSHADYDLVIISTMLDDEDGVRLATHVRSQESTRNISLIVLVDEDNRPLLAKALEVGIDDYVMTPIESNELLVRVQTQLKRKKYQDALRTNFQESISAATIDPLTNLFNRRYLDVHLEHLMQQAFEKSSDLSVMILDIDHFKAVNDKPGWGHHIGDEVLVELAQRLKNTVRTMDLIARMGGEKFVVVMPNASIDTAEKVAQRIRYNIEDTPFTISAEPGTCNCTVSIGVSTLKHSEGDNPALILQRADETLYIAKNNGRNMVVTSEQSHLW